MNPHTPSSLYIGLMSGTSMDSIDAVLVDFAGAQPALLCTCTTPIDSALREQLLSLCRTPAHPALGSLDHTLGEQFAETALLLLKQANIHAERVCAIGSHGQTIFHQPPANGVNGFSVQIADPNIIASRTGITTIADFRRKDMAVGGQGAPLVPAFHRAVFHNGQKNRVIVNIGGIANITVLPASGKVTGFDTGPGNVLMDGWIYRHCHKNYDAQGSWAASGKVDDRLLNKLLLEPYLHRAPPKSTGRELFNAEWLQQRLEHHITAVDVQATLAEFTARTIADAIEQYAPMTDEIFVCGGGACNDHLMQRLRESVKAPVNSTAVLGIEPQWVEASAFAWLARQTMENKPGNLPEVTGASKAVVLGGIYR